MEQPDKILFHATNANIHLQELLDLELKEVSTTSMEALKLATEITDEIAKRVYIKHGM